VSTSIEKVETGSSAATFTGFSVIFSKRSRPTYSWLGGGTLPSSTGTEAGADAIGARPAGIFR